MVSQENRTLRQEESGFEGGMSRRSPGHQVKRLQTEAEFDKVRIGEKEGRIVFVGQNKNINTTNF